MEEGWKDGKETHIAERNKRREEERGEDGEVKKKIDVKEKE